MSVHQVMSQIKTNADTACWAIHRPNGFSYVFAPTDHDFTLIHKAFACRPNKFLQAQTLLTTFPTHRQSSSLVKQATARKGGFMSLSTTPMMLHKQHTAPIRQAMPKILGGTALIFAMLLSFVSPVWALQVSPSALTFSATSGGIDPTPQSAILSNNREGDRERTWMATANAPWISITPSSGTITTEYDTISVMANTANLVAGSYSASVTITETSRTGKIRKTILPVTMSITGATTTPAIQLSLSSLAFTGTVGGNNPSAQTFTVTKTGTGSITWTASDNAAWLTLSPSTGTATAAVTTSVNLTGLAAGTHNATISVAVAGSSNTPQSILISLTVTANTATSTTLTWTANTESDLAGYKIYSGTQSGVYGTPISVGTVTSHVLTNLMNGTTYFFTITAYDTAGNESLYSSEQSKSIY